MTASEQCNKGKNGEAPKAGSREKKGRKGEEEGRPKMSSIGHLLTSKRQEEKRGKMLKKREGMP